LNQIFDFIINKPRPLALYYFGKEKREIESLCPPTTSGGVTINDCPEHAVFPDFPLVGVGNRGMGAYHGVHGLLQLSHSKAAHAGLVPHGKDGEAALYCVKNQDV
jgi:coniferyl-aldehyde dehydrogenase